MKTTTATKHNQSSQRSTTLPGISARRTGSALLIVIGTLALIAVFAIVYLSIGRTDRRTATAVKSNRAQKNASIAFGEYLSTIIGQDRLDAIPAYDGLGGSFGLREVTDGPYTDWTRRSESSLADGSDLFTAIGGPFSMGSLTAANDLRVASDPWLASTTPVFLGTPGINNFDRPFSNYAGLDPLYPNAKNFLDNRDLLQISNFAPDGRFVNLFNLRPNEAFGDSRVFGGFNAEPGTGVTVDPDTGRRTRRMSEYLSLLRKENQADANSLIRAFDPAFEGIWVPGQSVPTPGIVPASDIPNTPAVWTMYQRFMHMPINQPFITNNRLGVVSTWADPDYPAYQYADADGNGFADSRWFELTAARDANAGNNQNPRDDIEVLYDNDRYRYFIAARAVDLSSMVNVNTATDLLVAPTIDEPLGLTPADVDLRRLLTMQDQASDYTAFDNYIPLSLSQLHRPFNRDADSEPIWGMWNDGRADRNFARNVNDYRLYQHDYVGSDVRDIRNDTPAMLIGRYAYDALRQGIVLGGSLDPEYVGFSNTTSYMPPERRFLREYERNPVSLDANPYQQISAQRRVEQYRAVAQLDPTETGVSWARDSDYGSGLYGLEDLTELLTYYGLNDPAVTSRLERVTQGRYESDNGDEAQTRRMGPLMSNRPLALARDQHGLTVNDIATDNPDIRPQMAQPNFRSVTGRISFNSMAQNALSVRQYMTTLSGSVDLVPSQRVDDPSILEALDLDSTPKPMLVDTRSNSTEVSLLNMPNELFEAYASALAGELESNHTFWPTDVDMLPDNQDSTLFYGHRGPELALRIAAHTAANMKDMTDSDGDPTVMTLMVDNTPRTNLTNTNNFDNPGTDALYELYPGVASGNLLDPGQANLQSTLPVNRQAVNIYGFEAMPVLTEVSVLYAYTDAPFIPANSPAFGSDRDWNTAPSGEVILNINNGQITYPPISDINQVTIDGTKDQGNDDYLIEVLAFQLHNPYGHDISLGGSGINSRAPLTRQARFDDPDMINPASNYSFDYYIEYAGRFYKLAEYIEWYPTENNAANEFFTIDRTEARYNSVPNPANAIDPLLGDRMVPGTENSNAGNAGDYSNQEAFSDFRSRNVILGAGQTKVFYVIADKRFDDATPAINDDGVNPDDRWTRSMKDYGQLPNGFDPAFIATHDVDTDNLPDGPGDSRGWTGPAEQWVQHQFSVRNQGEPVMMMEFDPRDGKLVNETVSGALTDPTELAPSPIFANRNDIDEVRLWKKIVTNEEEADETNTGLNSPTYRNIIENDMLVDRMGIPNPLTRTFNGSDNIIEDTVSFHENLVGNFQGQPVRNDNTGLTYAQWTTVRRADSFDDRDPSEGEITPWMVRSLGLPGSTEFEDNPVLSGAGNNLVADPNASSFFDGGGSSLNDPQTEVTLWADFETKTSLRDFFDVSRNGASNEIIQTIALRPHLKHDVGNAPGGVEDDNGNDSVGKFPPHVLGISNTALDIANKAAPEIFVGGDNILKAPRLGDLLLAWGIGPSYSPDPTRGANSAEYVANEWVTGPEAMAIAMGVDVDPSPGDDSIAVSIWRDPYNTTNQDFLLDDGHLAIDHFVSYLNGTIESPPEFTTGSDVHRGTGVPMALGVIDHARAIAPIKQISDPDPARANPPLTPLEQLELALTRPTFGTVNINTAPIEVLRLLPGLTPSRASYNGPSGVVDEWWGTTLGALNLPDLGTADLAQNPDVASAIIAYRDRTYGVPNTAARIESVGAGFYETGALNFAPGDPTLMAMNMQGEFTSSLPLPAGVPAEGDRSAWTGIDGIRPTPGFGSLGELLAVRIDPEFETTDLPRWDRTKHLSIQQYGFDDEFSGIDGQNTIMSQVFDGNTTGTNIDDYAEKISMANAVLNTLSVRSDYFAVWFVVHGYQESDVSNLRPQDPLVPSIQKRYLMVIDRTNVIKPGDQPKIVVLKEVPM